MEAHLIHAIKYIYEFFSSIPASSWYAFGMLIGSSAVVSGILEIIKRRYATKHNVELAKHWIAIVLSVSSFLVSAAQGLIAYSTLNPKFLGSSTVYVIAFAYLIYNLGASKGYKAITAKLHRLQATADEYALETTVPVSSGTTTTTVGPNVLQ